MRILLVVLLAIAALAAPARAEEAWDKVVAAAKKEGKLVLYTSAEQTAPALAVVKAFENKFGIKVETVALRADESTDRIRTEQAAGRFLADIEERSAASIERQIAADPKLVAPHGGLPNLKNLREPFAATTLSVPAWAQAYGFLVSTDAVSDFQMPKVWPDLLDPKWEGRLLADDPRRPGAGETMFAATALKFGAEFEKKLAAQKLVLGHTPQDNTRRIVRGENPVYITQMYAMAAALMDAPIRVLVPSDGSPYEPIDHAMLRNAPHPNAARLFINYCLERDSQIAYANGWLQPVVKGAVEGANEAAKPFAAAQLLAAPTGNKIEEMKALAKTIYH